MTKQLILGAVLAGGRSRRFGTDKSEAMLGGQRLIEHAINSLKPHVAAVVVCGKTMPGFVKIADRPRPDLGPLGGLNGALHHAAAKGYDGVLTLGCDMPILPDEVAGELVGAEAAIVHGQHLVGYWPSTLAASLDEHLAAETDRSILKWLERCRPRTVVLHGSQLPNINIKADLEALQEQWPAA